jgi:hypothetical protein
MSFPSFPRSPIVIPPTLPRYTFLLIAISVFPLACFAYLLLRYLLLRYLFRRYLFLRYLLLCGDHHYLGSALFLCLCLLVLVFFIIHFQLLLVINC